MAPEAASQVQEPGRRFQIQQINRKLVYLLYYSIKILTKRRPRGRACPSNLDIPSLESSFGSGLEFCNLSGRKAYKAPLGGTEANESCHDIVLTTFLSAVPSGKCRKTREIDGGTRAIVPGDHPMDLPPEMVAVWATFAPLFSDRVGGKAQIRAVGAIE
jgi:hypothetical protein